MYFRLGKKTSLAREAEESEHAPCRAHTRNRGWCRRGFEMDTGNTGRAHVAERNELPASATSRKEATVLKSRLELPQCQLFPQHQMEPEKSPHSVVFEELVQTDRTKVRTKTGYPYQQATSTKYTVLIVLK